MVGIIGVMVIGTVLWSCRKKPSNPGEPHDNKTPTIRWINVPGDTIHHADEVFWMAYDSDGYIVRYDWAVDSLSWLGIDSFPQSGVLYPDSGHATSDTIAFKAPLPDTLYPHFFCVRAVDNDSAYSETIDRVLYLSNIPICNTRIAGGFPAGDTAFILPDTTADWLGITFVWVTEDSDEVLPPKFSYKWDDHPWSPWSEEAEVIFTGMVFDSLGMTDVYTDANPHTLYVRAMDDAGSIDSVGMVDTTTGDALNQRSVYFAYATKDQGILLVDETLNGSGTPGLPNDEQVDYFYDLIVTRAGGTIGKIIDNSARDNPPHYYDLAVSSVMIYHSDDVYDPYMNSRLRSTVSQYLAAGGDVWLTGSEMLKNVYLWPFPEPVSLGIYAYNEQSLPDFIGATAADPASGWPDLQIDSAKVLPQYAGKLPYVSVVLSADTSAVAFLYEFDSASDDTLFEGMPCGIRYTGDTFGAVVFDFPLYATVWDSTTGEPATTLASKVLEFFGE